MNEFLAITLTALLTSNVVASLGYGAISLQSEKRNVFYMLTASMITIVTTIVAGLAYFFINKHVLIGMDLEFLRAFVIVFLSSGLAFLSRILVKYMSREMFFLYEKSYQFATQIIISVSILLIVSYHVEFTATMFELATYSLGFLVVQFIFFPLYAKMDNLNSFKPARNIPLTLYILSIISMIIYTVSYYVIGG